jgi:hypothetical protein
MSSEKSAYQSIPSADGFVDDGGSETPLEITIHRASVRQTVWYIAQASLVIAIIAQSIAIFLLIEKASSSCQSMRTLPWNCQLFKV